MASNKRRGSKISTVSSKRGREFSKYIVIITGLIFILTLLDIRYMAMNGIDSSVFATQQILTTGGIFGASIIFYLNKSKIENLSKGKIRFLLLKLRLELKLKDKIPAEAYECVLSEINKISNMMDGKLDNALEEAIQEEINIQNF